MITELLVNAIAPGNSQHRSQHRKLYKMHCGCVLVSAMASRPITTEILGISDMICQIQVLLRLVTCHAQPFKRCFIARMIYLHEVQKCEIRGVCLLLDVAHVRPPDVVLKLQNAFVHPAEADVDQLAQ